MLKFAIRDDDVSYYSDFQVIKNIYSYLIGKGYKVSCSIIPKDTKSFNRGKENIFYQTKETRQIRHNKKLVALLTDYLSKNKIELLLHGYDHSYSKKGSKLIPELMYKQSDIIKNEMKKGKKLIENTFPTIVKGYVPPSNSFKANTIKALQDHGFSYISGTINPIYNHPISITGILNWLKYLSYLSTHFPHRYPFPIKYYELNELTFYPLNPGTNINDLKKSFLYCSKIDAPFVLAIHHWEISTNKILSEKFYEFIRFVDKQDYQPVTISEIFS